MSIQRLLLKADVSGLHSVRFSGQPVSNAYERLSDFLKSRIQGPASSLLAEPVASGSNWTWYGEGTGEPIALPLLPANQRKTADVHLTQALAAIGPLLDDPQLGLLLRRALVVPSFDSILALDDGVVFTNWGFAPSSVGDDPAALATHVSGMLGPYSPRLALIGMDFFSKLDGPAGATSSAGGGALAVAASPAGAAASSQRATAVGVAGSVPVRGTLPHARPAGRSFWLIPLFSLVAVGFLALGFWLAWAQFARDIGSRQYSTPMMDEGASRIALQTQRETNLALERDLERARRALDQSNVCLPEFPAGTVPLERQPVPPAAVPKPAPERRGEAPTPFNGSLSDLLERSTVWIVVGSQEGTSSGTGFFITTDTILTNAHVVQNASLDNIFITSKSLGRVLKGQVAAMTTGPNGGKVGVGMADFAIIRLAEPAARAQPLAFSEKAEKLADVVAAGYPSAIIRHEEAVRELQQGRLTSAPELVLTRGSISSMQRLPNGLTILPHSADISGGNSGGPLVDACGSVLGINTFVTAAERFADRTKYALRSDGILQWLAQQQVQVQKNTDDCRPVVANFLAPSGRSPTIPYGSAPPLMIPAGVGPGTGPSPEPGMGLGAGPGAGPPSSTQPSPPAPK